MITAAIPLRYHPSRYYLGKTESFLNQKLSIDSLLHCSDISKIIIVSHTPEYISKEDHQIDFIKNHYKNEDRIKIIDLRHGDFFFNQSWLLNIAIRNTETPYFMRIDIDCILEPKFSKIFRNSKSILETKGIFEGGLHGIDEENIDWTSFNYLNDFYQYQGKLKYNIYSHSHIVVDTESLRRIQGYDERFQVWGCEDDDIVKRLIKTGYTLKRKTYKLIHQNHFILNETCMSEQEIEAKKNRFKYLYDEKVIKNDKNWGNLEFPLIERVNL